MQMNIIIEIIILYAFSLLLIWQFVGYPSLMGVIALRNVDKKKNHLSNYYPLSIVVPTYNEASGIKQRIINLYDLDYPSNLYEIIVVDSGSDDGTQKIVESLITERNENQPQLKLIIEENRRGKASAINLGKEASKHEIILVTDGNAKFNHDVLKKVMPYFDNPKIGAIGGRYCVENLQDPIASLESFYWDLEVIMRLGESFIDSACLFHGEINFWRKDIVDADIKALSEDLDMCVNIREKGYKIEYEPAAIVYESSADKVEDQIKQRKRTTIGTIQNLFKHHKYLLFPRDIYSLLIFHSHKTLQILSPFFLIGIFVLYTISLNINVILTHLISSMFVFIILFLLLIHVKSKLLKNKEDNYLFKSIPKLVYYVILNEFIVFMGWKDFIFNKYSVLWEKVPRKGK